MLIDVESLLDVVEISATAEDAVSYLANGYTFTELVLQALFPPGVAYEKLFRPAADEGPAAEDEVGGRPPPDAPYNWRMAVLEAAGTGYYRETADSGSRVFTVLDLLRDNLNPVLEQCAKRCETSDKAKDMLLNWCVKTGVWKCSNQDPLCEDFQFPMICNSAADSEVTIVKMMVAHARKLALSEIAQRLLVWLSNANCAADCVSTLHIIDPARMSTCSVVQLISRFGWQPSFPKHLPVPSTLDKELIKVLLLLCESKTAVHVFNALQQLPRACARLQDNPEHLEEALSVLIPPSLSLNSLPSSLLTTAPNAWWDNHEHLKILARTLAQPIATQGGVPFSALLRLCILDDQSDCEVAVEEAFFLYVLTQLTPVEFDAKRMAHLTPSELSHLLQKSSADWALSLFNWSVQQYLDAFPDRSVAFIVRLFTANEELRILQQALSQKGFPRKLVWRALLQAARNCFDGDPPGLARYVSPELLAQVPSVAKFATAFEFWWTGLHKAPAMWSLLSGYRLLLADYCLEQEGQPSPSVSKSLLDASTTRVIDDLFLPGALYEDGRRGCDDFLIGILYFHLTDRVPLALQLLRGSTCSCANVMMALLNPRLPNTTWGCALSSLLMRYASNSEQSLHVTSVCTLLSMFPPHAALALLRGHMKTSRHDIRGLPLSWDAPPVRISARYVGAGDGANGTSMTALMNHVTGGLLLDEINPPDKLLSIHAARDIIKSIGSRSETVAPRLTLEEAIKAVYQSGKQLHVLGMALWESVRLLIADQSSMQSELEKKCYKMLDSSMQYSESSSEVTHHVSLSSTVCDLCGTLLIHHGAELELAELEKEAFSRKVCAMAVCNHRFHAVCLRSISIALQHADKAFLESYAQLIQLFDASTPDSTEVRLEIVKDLQHLIGAKCPLCSDDYTCLVASHS